MKLPMNLAELQKKLIAAARAHPPEDRVPYAFEKRIMAQLGKAPKTDEWGYLARALWCGAAVCTAVAIATSVWSFEPATDDSVLAFSQDLEQTILASPDDLETVW
jgi:hypothetical protein